ncbi:DNA gyrase inhibitor YacG [Orbus wheelerorum]|uniref:DNA gyrase inhibitor YacG n=1 Tax=Orbus wheelerorum TaxID=3074111 RepID=UPI00370D2FFA
MKTDKLTVSCPTCQKLIVWDEKNPYRPFCSKRCQLIDLGEWANETHRIPTDEINEQDLWSEDVIAPFNSKDN